MPKQVTIHYLNQWCPSLLMYICFTQPQWVNTLRSRQNRRHFVDDMFECIFLIENVWIPIEISMKFVPKGPINNIQAMVQIMAWRRPGDKPLSEPMMDISTTHICVTRPQWVNIGSMQLIKGHTFLRMGEFWQAHYWWKWSDLVSTLWYYKDGTLYIDHNYGGVLCGMSGMPFID